MDSRGLQRSQRETRVIQNLPLRRRCLFLADPRFLHECFSAADASAQTRAASTAELLRSFATFLNKNTTSENVSLLHAAEDMLRFLSVPPSSATTAQIGWEEGLETLLSHLEDVREVDFTGSSPATSGPLPFNSKGERAAPVNPRSTDTEAAVRQLLCTLVKHLYDYGAVFYAAEKERAQAVAGARKRRRTEGNESLSTEAELSSGTADLHFPMRVTWSIAAPVASSLQELYRLR